MVSLQLTVMCFVAHRLPIHVKQYILHTDTVHAKEPLIEGWFIFQKDIKDKRGDADKV